MVDGIVKYTRLVQVGSPDKADAGLRTVGIALAGSVFVAVCAHISLSLLFSPVPLTMQPFAVLLLALVLSPGAAFSVLALYLAEGAMGFPVFTPHGVGGVTQLLGPTGGYLLSYPFAAAIISWLAHRGSQTFSTKAWSAAAGNVLVLLSGALWFGLMTHVNLKTLMNTTVLPFLPGDALKVVAAAAIATAWQRVSKRHPQGEAD